MKHCENCGVEHDGTYGSGRFCSTKCSRGFSTKAKRKEINKKISDSLQKLGHDNVILICQHCKKSFEVVWSKRNQKFCSRSCNSIEQNSKRSITDDTKNKISESLKEAYRNGKKVYGGYTKWHSIKTSKGILKVQGTYELKTCNILDKCKNENIILDWEYTKDRISYIGIDNKKHSYLLDFKVFRNDGTWYYLEVKGFERPNDKLKWQSVKDNGYELEIWFEKDIINNE